MAPRPKHLCGCGCALYVSRDVELGHLNGRRSAVLAANTLSQNRSLLRNRKKASKLRLSLSSRRSQEQEPIGRPAPLRQQFLSGEAPWPDRLSSENSPSKTAHEYNDFPASEAGPSRLPSHTIDLDMTFSTQRSPTPETQDLPFPPPMPLQPNADGRDRYGLSAQRRSHRITERVERIGRVRWGTNHVQFIEREEMQEDEEEANVAGDIEDEEDGMLHNDDEHEDEEDMPFAEPGQEGISVWDLLGDGFLNEVADLGNYF
jgi:hypothetical protein